MPMTGRDQRDRGKLGAQSRIVGLACFGGLLAMLVGSTRSSGWGLMHNHLGVFLFGTLCIFVAPVWLLVSVGVGIKRRGAWRPLEVVLLVAVAIGLLLTVVSLGS